MQELTRVCRAGFERLCADSTERLAPFGFSRTRKTFWTRPHTATVDVLHFHRGGVSYGAPISASVDVRIHLAIRVLNDDFQAIALNGPSTDTLRGQQPALHLSFNARSFSQYDRCLDDAARYFREHALPWFDAFRDPLVLTNAPESPLDPDSRSRLRAALTASPDQTAIDASRRLLGLNKRSKRKPE